MLRRRYHKEAVNIIGMLNRHGQGKAGVELGPEVLVQNGLLDQFKDFHVNYHTIEEELEGEAVETGIIRESLPMRRKKVSEYNHRAYEYLQQATPTATPSLLLGGDHSSVVGSIAHYLEKYQQGLGILWVDAHSDINTFQSSPSGNIHGMPVSLLMKVCQHPDFHWLSSIPALQPQQICYIGLRDIDLGERKLLNEMNVCYFEMEDVRQMGFDTVLNICMDKLVGKQIYYSLDVDATDPAYIPCTGTPVEGGLEVDEINKISTYLHKSNRLVHMDCVEVNPFIAPQAIETTATIANGYITRAFGIPSE